MVAFAFAACSKGPVSTLHVDGHPVMVEVVADEAGRSRGLMFRDSLPHDGGMWFAYPDEKVRNFWMKDTRIPLSIAFVDGHGKIVSIADMKPFDTTPTSSLVPAKYALEMNQGWFAENGVERGDAVTDLPVVEAR